MKYICLTAWTIEAGPVLESGAVDLELLSNPDSRLVLTVSPDAHLRILDQQTAIENGMLSALFRAQPFGSTAAVKAGIEAIQASRSATAAGKTFLIFRSSGDVQCEVGRHFQLGDAIVTFDLVEKDVLGAQHKAAVNIMLTAISLEYAYLVRCASVTQGMYFRDDQGRVVHSFSLSGSGRASALSKVSDVQAREMATSIAAIASDSDLDSVCRLVSQFVDAGSDNLKTFLVGWNAFEILIAKAFGALEVRFDDPLLALVQPALRSLLLERRRNAIRFALMDKFLVVSIVLFPFQSPDDSQADLNSFKSLKATRDHLFHGRNVEVASLPVHQIALLLRKYLRAYTRIDDARKLEASA